MSTFQIITFLIVVILSTAAYERNNRIINGRLAQEVYPFLVSLWITDGKLELHCGGALITSQVVLTAAHCFYDLDKVPLKNPFMVAFLNTLIINNGTMRTSNDVVIHSQFQFHNNTLNNDIALVFLDNPVPFQPITLPATPDVQASAGDIIHIVGWGETGHATDSYQLIEARVTLANRLKFPCNQDENINTKLCVLLGLPEYVSTGKGDSGGPVFLRLEGKDPVIVGIVSNTVNLPPHSRLNIFTDVSKFLPWIFSFINTNVKN